MSTKLMLHIIDLVFSAAMFSFIVGSALAQQYPSRPITLVVPFAAGTGADITGRAIAPTLGEFLGQSMVVDNRGGGGGSIGAKMVAKARPDGYTILLASISFSVIPSLMKLEFDPVKDFEPVTMVGIQPYVLVVPPLLPVNSIKELIALARSKPGQLNYATSGIGGLGHLQWEMIKKERNIDIVHIPRKGTSEALTDILAGRVQILLTPLPTGLPQIKAGRVKALGVTGDKRALQLPDVPTVYDAGFPSLNDSVWYAILVPAGTPKEIVTQINAAFVKTLLKPDAIERLARAATEPKSSTPEESATFIKAQVAKWAKVINDAGIRIDVF
ncbi:MAG: tripartite tricarboxylate transporter substrate binding protein [Armatimonadota bacterium]|nr:tripartite tricarboxylate transporter substrate binding protein [Armatimonadota bacterium]